MNISFVHRSMIHLAALGCTAAALPAVAAPPDARLAEGSAIAQRQCSACHIVAKHQEFPPLLAPPAPSFFDIARRPGLTEQALVKTISGKHWDLKSVPMTMPNQELEPGEARAVAHYLLSLNPGAKTTPAEKP